MGAIIASFEDMIAPTSLAEFFSKYWEKQPLFMRRSSPHYYEPLLTLENVQNAISAGGLRYPAIQLSKGGGFLPPEAYCQDIRSGDVVFSGVPNIGRLHAEYQSGATISLPGFHRAWEPLQRLTTAVEAYLDHAIHTNVYLTPGAVSGFGPHYDVHDVFVFQISGSKHWKIYSPIFDLPHASQPFRPQMFTQSAPLLELDIEPGDLLYLPRGFVHTTNTTDRASAHVTLGVTVYTWMELLAIWLQSSKNDVAFRRALPPGFASRPELKQGLKAEFSKLVSGLHDKLDGENVIESFLQRVREGYPGQRGSSVEFDANAVAIGPGSQLQTLPRDRYARAEEGGSLILRFEGKTIPVSVRARATLDAICERSSFKPAELPSELSEETRLFLIRHLYKEGFLNLAG
jgi:hypothetical protein